MSKIILRYLTPEAHSISLLFILSFRFGKIFVFFRQMKKIARGRARGALIIVLVFIFNLVLSPKVITGYAALVAISYANNMPAPSRLRHTNTVQFQYL